MPAPSRSVPCRPTIPQPQLLYAYVIENVLKGLLVANSPGLIAEQRLNGELQSHAPAKHAAKASFSVHVQEGPVLDALSRLSTCAGRYPVTRTRREQVGVPNADAALDYGHAHPVMRAFFERARQELEGSIVEPLPYQPDLARLLLRNPEPHSLIESPSNRQQLRSHRRLAQGENYDSEAQTWPFQGP